MTELRTGFWPEEREPTAEELTLSAALHRLEECRATLLRWVEEMGAGARHAFKHEVWAFERAVREDENCRQRMKGAVASAVSDLSPDKASNG